MYLLWSLIKFNFCYWNDIFAVHAIVMIYPIAYVHVSVLVTYFYTVSVSVKKSV